MAATSGTGASAAGSLRDQDLTPDDLKSELEERLPGAEIELAPEQEMMTINMGPHHPATHGVLRLVVELEGEVVRDLKPMVGYVHTGIEKSCETMSYWKVIPFVERMDYLSYFFNIRPTSAPWRSWSGSSCRAAPSTCGFSTWS